MIGTLAATERERVDLFPMIQFLALEIAGRTMFSLEMGQHGPALREQIMRYGQRLGRPHLLDFVVPISIPTPHDWTRNEPRQHRPGLTCAGSVLLVYLGAAGSPQFVELSIVRLILSRHAGVANYALPGRGGVHHSSLVN
jgi:hypothetical protein